MAQYKMLNIKTARYPAGQPEQATVRDLWIKSDGVVVIEPHKDRADWSWVTLDTRSGHQTYLSTRTAADLMKEMGE